MKKILFVVLFLALFSTSWATTVTVCTSANINAAILATPPGDEVYLDCATASLSATINMNRGVTIRGRGKTATVVSGEASPLFLITGTSTTSGDYRLSGMNFTGTRYNDVVVQGGFGSIRIDNILWETSNMPSGIAIYVGKYNSYYDVYYGINYASQKMLIDNITYDGTTPTWIRIDGRNHRAWQEADGFGTDNFVFIEESEFTFGNCGFLTDTEYGARFVFRYNTVVNGSLQTHDLGGGTSQPARGNRAQEIYGNDTSTTLGCWSAMQFTRGGTALVYDNTFTNWGVQQYPQIFRVTNPYWTAGTGYCGDNAPMKRCTDVVRHSTVDHKPCFTDSATCTFTCSTNSDCLDSLGNEGICMTVDGTGDPSGYPCRDQTGRGVEDSSGVQSSSPLYWWNNTVDGVANSTAGSMGSYASYIVADRDYCDTVAKAPTGTWPNYTMKACGSKGAWTYTAYPYPHLWRQGGPIQDTTAPYITNPIPSGSISCSADPVDVVLGVTTNENATCKYNTSDVAYASMTGTFDGTGTQTHTKTISLACDASYTYYARCQDTSPNLNKNSTSTSIVFTVLPVGEAVTGPLTVNTTNPRYFDDGTGKAIYLTGSHYWDVIQKFTSGSTCCDAEAEFTDYLDWMQGLGLNFIRLWTNLSNTSVDVKPWNLTDGIADLTDFNQTYFDLLAARVAEITSRGMYASVMLFGSGITMKTQTSWEGSYWNPALNSNAALDPPVFSLTDGTTFFTTDAGALALQYALIAKTIDTLYAEDNIIWEIINEAALPTSATWQDTMMAYIRAYELANYPNNQHLILMSTGGGASELTYLTGSDADAISPGGDGGYELTAGGPGDYTAKIVINDTDHVTSTGYLIPAEIDADLSWVWRAFTRGTHPIVMDHYNRTIAPYNDGTIMAQYDPIRAAMGHTLVYATKMNLVGTTPSTTISSTTYALYEAGKEYLVYQPSNASFTVTLTAGTYDVEWFNVATGAVSSGTKFTASAGSRTFTPPYAHSVLYLRSEQIVLPNPTMTNPRPTGYWECDANPRTITIMLDTPEEDSTCKYCQSGVSGCDSDTSYASMAGTYSTTGAKAHEQELSLSCSATYVYYSRCGAGNISSAITTFEIGTSALSGMIEAEDGTIGSPVVDNSYAETNYVAGQVYWLSSVDATAVGQSFVTKGGILETAKFHMGKVLLPTGNAVAKIYAHSGTFGTSSVPTGSALATSDNLDVSTLDVYPTMGLQTFTFSGANRITLTPFTQYVVTLEYSGGDANNRIYAGFDNSPAHVGNSAEYRDSTWTAYSDDLCFYVYVTTFAEVADTSASGGIYVKSLSEAAGTLTFTVAVATAGTYRIVGKVWAVDTGADSIYLQINALDQIVWNISKDGIYNAWKYMDVNNSNDNYTVTLTADNHTFVFTNREANVRLDLFYLASIGDPAQTPEPIDFMIIPTSGASMKLESGSGSTMKLE